MISACARSEGAPAISLEAAGRAYAEKHIGEAYRRIQQVSAHYRDRPEQKKLSTETLLALLAGKPLVCEAPTGSGKTIGYSIGALEACKQLRIPLVIATGTVSLQNQIMDQDLRTLANAGLVNLSACKLVKGRGRYFCPQAAEALSEGGARVFQADLFRTDANAREEAMRDAEEAAPGLLQAFREGGWAGSRDDLPKGIQPPKGRAWQILASNSDTCSRHNCEHYSVCPFFRDKAQWADAEVLVANHNLVMLDLVSAWEGREPVFPFDRYVLVVDEAHNLPSRALECAKTEFAPGTMQDKIGELRKFVLEMQSAAGTYKTLLDRSEKAPHTLLNEAEAAVVSIESTLKAHEVSSEHIDDNETPMLSPAIADSLLQSLALQTPPVTALADFVQEAVNVLNGAVKKASDKPELSRKLRALLSKGGVLNGEIRSQARALVEFSGQDVRWFRVRGRDAALDKREVTLNGSPLEGSGLLREVLWDGGRALPVLVSATLQGMRRNARNPDFSFFAHEVGLSLDGCGWSRLVLESPFNYQESRLLQYQIRKRPNEVGFEGVLASELEVVLQDGLLGHADQGTLVLFTNRRTMLAVAAHIEPRMPAGSRLLVQDVHGSAASIRARHYELVDGGLKSVVFGLKSLAEGFDLPGHYCTHVVITQLPFESPADPIQQERERRHEGRGPGRSYFDMCVLPRVARDLNQMVGRLLRREDDRGRITVMDDRQTTGYGFRLILALPSFDRRRWAPFDELVPSSRNVVSMQDARTRRLS